MQHEEDFEQDCISFINILAICQRFIDIGSIGVKIVYGNGKQLKQDSDVYAMFKEHTGLKDIHVYVEEDRAEQPVPLRMPYYKLHQGTSNFYFLIYISPFWFLHMKAICASFLLISKVASQFTFT